MDSQKLKELRISLDMTQKDMAQVLGVSRSFYALMETGKRVISTEIEAQIMRLTPISYVEGYGQNTDSDKGKTLNEPSSVYSVTPQYARKNLMSLIEMVDSGQEVVISVGAKKYRLSDCSQSASPSLDSWFDIPANIAKLTERIRTYEEGKEKTVSLEEARQEWANMK